MLKAFSFGKNRANGPIKAAMMDHIKRIRLFDLAQAQINDRSFGLTSWEEAHLLECYACQDSLGTLLRDTSPEDEFFDSSA
jgi:hypothetical protein